MKTLFILKKEEPIKISAILKLAINATRAFIKELINTI